MTEAEKDWQKAKEHLDSVIGVYESFRNMPQVNVGYALSWMNDVRDRYERGERTDELYEEMMGADV